MAQILFNGKIISDQLFNGINRGLYYADGLFETIRLVNGKVHLLELHLKRLLGGMKQLGLLPNESLQKEHLTQMITELAALDKIENARIRLTVYRRAGGAFIPETDEVDWVCTLTEIDNDGFKLNRKGVLMDVYTDKVKSSDIRLPYKPLNSNFYVQAGRKARDEHWEEAFILNERREIIESIHANVFYIKGEKVFTPPLSSGCLPGTMRALIVHLLQKQGIQIVERVLKPEELFDIDELFLTNSIKGIQWVGAYRSKRFYSRHIREISGLLNRLV